MISNKHEEQHERKTYAYLYVRRGEIASSECVEVVGCKSVVVITIW